MTINLTIPRYYPSCDPYTEELLDRCRRIAEILEEPIEKLLEQCRRIAEEQWKT